MTDTRELFRALKMALGFTLLAYSHVVTMLLPPSYASQKNLCTSGSCK